MGTPTRSRGKMINDVARGGRDHQRGRGTSGCSRTTFLLMQLMAVQNPYVYCLNVLQAETLLANYPVLGLYRSTSHPRIGRLYCDESRHKTLRRQEEDNANSVIKNEYTTIRYEGYRQIITNKNEPIIIMNTHNK